MRPTKHTIPYDVWLNYTPEQKRYYRNLYPHLKITGKPNNIGPSLDNHAVQEYMVKYGVTLRCARIRVFRGEHLTPPTKKMLDNIRQINVRKEKGKAPDYVRPEYFKTDLNGYELWAKKGKKWVKMI